MKLERIIYQNILPLTMFFCMLFSCKKLVKVDLPIDKTTREFVFDQSSTAISAMTGIYASLNFEGNFVGRTGPSFFGGLLADELESSNTEEIDYLNNVDGELGANNGIWDSSYRRIIYRANSVIEGVEASEKLPIETKKILLGEAKFIRALTYFNLVNFFGDVPLVLTTDFKVNTNIPRSDRSKVYAQIISDLLEARESLKDNYLAKDLISSTPERIRPNKVAATALLARVYLYTEKWKEAEAEATKIIENIGQYDLVPLDDVFTMNNKEIIWQLQPNKNDPDGPNTSDGRVNSPDIGYKLSPFLMQAFETNDQRKVKWTKFLTDGIGNAGYIPYKYKLGKFDTPQQEYTVVLRLAEQYLIRSEARVHLGNLEGVNSAESDLNKVRLRAGLPKAVFSSHDDILNLIAHERYVELFVEYSHRWFDLKRTSKIDSRMTIVCHEKGGEWMPYKALMPIPYREFLYNSALVGHQNPGYREVK